MTDAELRALIERIETTRSYWGVGEDGKYRDHAKTEIVKAMAEELLARREIQKGLEKIKSYEEICAEIEANFQAKLKARASE